MTDIKKKGKRTFLKWLSDRILSSHGSKPKPISGELIESRPSEKIKVSKTIVIEGTDTTKPMSEPISQIELSEELQGVIPGDRFEILRDALRMEGIITLDQFKLVSLWSFLNQHDLYPINERISVFEYIQDQLTREPVFKDKEGVSGEQSLEALSQVCNTSTEEANAKRTVNKESIKPKDRSVTPYCKLYSLDLDIYRTYPLTNTGLSGRLRNLLMRNGISNLGELLEQSDSIVLAMDGFGNSSLKELQMYFRNLSKTGSVRLSSSVERQRIKDFLREEGSDERPVAPKEPSITPYFELYSLEPNDYSMYPATDAGFSVRVINRILGQGICNIGELLKQSDFTMLGISGFGAGCLKELHTFFKKLASEGSIRPNSLDAKTIQLEELKKEAYELVDVELLEEAAKGEPAVLAVNAMLKEFVAEYECKKACETALESIPSKRLSLPAKDFLQAYTDNNEKRVFLTEKCSKGATLKHFIVTNASLIVAKNAIMASFLRWCEYNVIDEVEMFFDERLAKESIRQVICGRARGDTLSQVGDKLGVTRERVRQIEVKFFKSAKYWFQHNRIIFKLFLDFAGEEFLSPTQIADYIGCYGLETVALLKKYSGEGYYYDERADRFSLGQPLDYNGMQEYINTLPDFIMADGLDILIKDGNQKYGYPEDQLWTILNGSFHKTGKLFHRSRLILSYVYGETLKKYYPNGIHLDDEEIKHFLKLAQDEFEIDLSDKTANSVSTIITRIGILCGRGKYKLKTDDPYLSKGLVRRIRAYIKNSSTPIVLINAIYLEFEAELRKEGINNRYHLQGILKELFGDVWTIKRDYVATDSEVTSVYEAIGNYIAKATSPVTKEEVMRHFPGLTDIVLNIAVSGSDIINLFGSYINASRLSLSDNDVHYLQNKLDEALSENEICYIRDLYNDILLERPGLLSGNYVTAGFALFSILEYLFRDDYNFSRPFISKEGAEIKSILSVLKEMVGDSDLVELSDILSFAAEHNYPLPSIIGFANSCNGTHLMINAQELATFDYIGVDESIARQVEQLIKDEITEVVPISHLSCVNKLPPIKVKWNAWLIYSILNKWSTDLIVGTVKSLFKATYPLVAPEGASLNIEFDKNISHNGELITADNLDNIEDLIAEFITDELGDIDEF